MNVDDDFAILRRLDIIEDKLNALLPLETKREIENRATDRDLRYLRQKMEWDKRHGLRR